METTISINGLPTLGARIICQAIQGSNSITNETWHAEACFGGLLVMTNMFVALGEILIGKK